MIQKTKIMNAQNPFIEKMEAHEDLELLKIIKMKDEYQEAAAEAAIQVAKQRGLIDDNLNIKNEDLANSEEVKLAEEKVSKLNSKDKKSAIKRKRRPIRLAIIGVVILVITLSFHFVPSRGMVFAKSHLTFSYTIITEDDIQEIIKRYNNASFSQRIAMNNEPIIRKLMEKGIIKEVK